MQARLNQYTEFEWREIVQIAARHGVSPLLYSRVADLGNRTIPESLLQSLREGFLMNAARNALIYQDLTEILGALEQENIPVLLLKGVHLAAGVYDHPGQRWMGDIDLLVPRECLFQAARQFQSLGYSFEKAEQGFDFEDWCRTMHHLPALFKPPRARVELHLKLTPAREPFEIDTAGLFERAQPVSLPDAKAPSANGCGPALTRGSNGRGLCREDLLLHVCVHSAGAHDIYSMGLRPLCDIAAVIRRLGPAMDWDTTASRAKLWRAERHVHLALWLARDLLAVPIPEAFLRALAGVRFDPAWGNLAREQILSPGMFSWSANSAPALGPMWSLSQFASAGLKGKLALILRYAFPSRADLSRRQAIQIRDVRYWRCYPRHVAQITGRGVRLLWHAARHISEALTRARQLRRSNELRQWLQAR